MLVYIHLEQLVSLNMVFKQNLNPGQNSQNSCQNGAEDIL